MKFTIGLMAADHCDVAAALHKMRVVSPTNASTAKAEAGYGQTFSDAVRADLAAHPGFREHCAPAQEAMHSGHAEPAGVIIRATNIGRMVKDGMPELPQASLNL
jgi:hypothetical protein